MRKKCIKCGQNGVYVDKNFVKGNLNFNYFVWSYSCNLPNLVIL